MEKDLHGLITNRYVSTLKVAVFCNRNVTTMHINLTLISNSLDFQMPRILSLNVWDVSFLFSIVYQSSCCLSVCVFVCKYFQT